MHFGVGLGTPRTPVIAETRRGAIVLSLQLQPIPAISQLRAATVNSSYWELSVLEPASRRNL
jgi:hypothetical protein